MFADESFGFLDKPESDRFRHLLVNYCIHHGLPVWKVEDELGGEPIISRPTLARGFSDEGGVKIRIHHAKRYTIWLANRAGVDAVVIWNWVRTGKGDIPKLRLYAAAEIFPHTAAGMLRYRNYLNQLRQKSEKCMHFSATPCSPLVPESARHALICHEMRERSDGPQRIRVEKEYAKESRKYYKNLRPAERAKVQTWLMLNRLGLEKWAKMLAEGAPRDELIVSVLDGHEAGVYQLALVDDRPGRDGAHLRPYFEQYDRRSVFDGRISLRRDPNTWNRFTFRAGESEIQAAAVAEDRAVLETALAAALKDYLPIRRILRTYMSDHDWRRDNDSWN